MKISEMIANLKEFMEEHGDLECWYAIDAEGNGYDRVYYSPSLFFVTVDDEVLQWEDVEDEELSPDEYEEICVVN